jgi:hypothetical protein
MASANAVSVRDGILRPYDEIVPSQRFSEFMRSMESQVDRQRTLYIKRGE